MQANRLSDSTTVSVRSVDRSQMQPNRISQASSQLTPPSATPSNSTVDTEPLFAQIQTNLQSLHKALRAAKSSAEIDPPLLLSPLKTLLLTCRTVSETATPIDSTLLTLTEDAKHRLSDSLVALMSTTKSFSLKEQGVTPLDVDRHLQSVAACVESLHLVVTTPPALADPLFVENIKDFIHVKTDASIEAVQGLLAVLRTVTPGNAGGVLSAGVVPRLLAISEGVDELLGGVFGVVSRAEVFGVERGVLERCLEELDRAKAGLEDVGGELAAGWVSGGGEAEVRVVKRNVGTAAYAVVRGMKEFCDLFGV
ncbi:hypothetical protein HDU79_000572 [Rhizoclosmatium sp. JEL0117]|nr:hypothetical protein HDU79_000572 [Rhizoclosmatium sp. JEL0117]